MKKHNAQEHIELNRMIGMATAYGSTLNRLRVNLMVVVTKSMESATKEDRGEIKRLIDEWPSGDGEVYRSKNQGRGN